MALLPGITQPKNSLRMIRGTSKTFTLAVKDEEGNPVNLTGARVIFSVKKTICEDYCLLQKDSAHGVSEVDITEPKAGLAEIYLTPGDTQTWGTGEYVFDVWVVLVSGKRYAVVPPSILEIEAGVTVIT